jgi:undecaprenyl diphosphate synthase
VNLPGHIAIIMDGNGRWAKERRRPRIFGHIKGARVAKKIISRSVELGIKDLTLYAFSTENWGRPAEEVNFLMRLLKRYLHRERHLLVKQNIRFNVIGQYKDLPAPVIEEIELTIEASKANTGMNLTFALNYGGRQELVQVMRELAYQVKNSKLSAQDINEEIVSELLLKTSVGDPDLIIRTSGELRLSNFLTWQAAYSELYFTNTLWPDFEVIDFEKALESYKKRERRFGQTSEQIIATSIHGGLE